MDSAEVTLQSSFLFRIHPLTKQIFFISSFLISMADLFSLQEVPLLSPILGVLIFILVCIAEPGLCSTWVRWLIGLQLPVVISLILVQGFFYPHSHEILWQWGFLSLKGEGLRFAATVAGRLFFISNSGLLLFLTTSSEDIAFSLRTCGLPFWISHLFLSALQLLPRFQKNARSILEAQRARGLKTEGGLKVRIKALLPLTVPLLGRSLMEAEERALAWDARGFHTKGPKTSFKTLPEERWEKPLRWILLMTSFYLLILGIMT